MTRGRLLAAVIAVAAAGLTYALVSGKELPAEEVIRRKAIAMADAAEKKDVGFIMKQVSERFRADSGLSRDEVKGFLAAQLLRGEWVRVFTANVEVTLTSASTADFRGTYVLARSQAKLLKDLARESVVGSYEITGKVERESDGEWRFVSAGWKEADPGSLL